MVSACIAACDRPSQLARCLDALLSGSVLPAEIVVVDQSGDDACARVVADRRGRLADGRLIHHGQPRLGLSASRNAAIAISTSPVVAVTDDDCVPDERWVEVMIRELRGPDAPDAVTGRLLPYGQASPGTYPTASRVSTVRRDFLGRCLPWEVGTAANFAVRRDWLKRIGGYDERLGVGTRGRAGEDIDVFNRLLQAGARIRYLPESVMWHQRIGFRKRIANRTAYGIGIGAMCTISARRGDEYARTILRSWVKIRMRLLARSLVRLQPLGVLEEVLVLTGTARGLFVGTRA